MRKGGDDANFRLKTQRALKKGVGIQSHRALRAIDALARAWRDDPRARDAFQEWRKIWRSISNAPVAPRARDVASLLAERFDSQTVDPVERIDAAIFALQTYAARAIVDLVERFFHLPDGAADELFDLELFRWSDVARQKIDDDALRAMQLDVAARFFDPFSALPALFFSPCIRRRFGEFYTPTPVAEFLFERALAILRARRDSTSDPFPSVCDPACGAGVFLTVAARKMRERDVALADALQRLEGADLSPLAVVVANANLLFAATADMPQERRDAEIRELIRARRDGVPPPVVLRDAIDDVDPLKRPKFARNERRFDLALGNPPWTAWEETSRQFRDSIAKYWRDYGLFDLSGSKARLGGGKKNLAALFALIALDRKLAPNGAFAFVLPKSLFHTTSAGSGFRRFGRGENARNSLKITPLEFDDFSEFSLFRYVATRAVALLGREGVDDAAPIRARKWRAHPDAEPNRARDTFQWRNWVADLGVARPCDARPGAPWILDFNSQNDALDAPPTPSRGDDFERARADVDELARAVLARPPRRPARDAMLGANAAGASAVFWMEALEPLDGELVRVRNLSGSGRRAAPRVEAVVESALLFPLLRWRDVDEYVARHPNTFALVPQDPTTRRGFDLETMRARFPNALRYLAQFEDLLKERAAFRKMSAAAPFWSMYNVAEQTFAHRKVVWRRMDAALRAALVETDETQRPVVPQETLVFVPVDSQREGDCLVAILNSAPAREIVERASVPRAKSFGSPGIFANLALPAFDERDPELSALADLGAALRELAKDRPRRKEPTVRRKRIS